MLETINEPIEVIVLFRASKLIPIKFQWQGREFAVKKVNLIYNHREGTTKIYYFAVSDGVNYFKLQFNTENLQWTLLETYSD